MPSLTLITGTGRSGTSTMAGTLHHLGVPVPGPLYEANESNPKGFYESVWAMKFHGRITAKANINDFDGRPEAFELAREAIGPVFRRELTEFLASHADLDQIVVKDPRTVWAQWLWREVAAEHGRETNFLTMVRHPAEVIGSRSTYYHRSEDRARLIRYQTISLGRWINNTLISERETRGHRRAFVPYTELLVDWRPVMSGLAGRLGLRYDADPASGEPSPVDDWIDPQLRRHAPTWEAVAVPDRLREIADGLWRGLELLASGEADREAEAEAVFDTWAPVFTDLSAMASAMSNDEVKAGVRAGRRQGRRNLRKKLEAEGRL